MQRPEVLQEVSETPYKKRWRFSAPTILINERNIPPYLSWLDGTNMEEKTAFVRWGFCFEAPINKSWNSWRWAWIKIFGKLWVIRWTFPTFYYG